MNKRIYFLRRGGVWSVYFAILAVLVLAGACKKNQDHGQRPLAITAFYPASGLAHTVVTVYGSGFGADTLHNQVTFNGSRAQILQVTDTSLVVMAPDGGSTGPVAVTANGSKVTGGTYTYQLLSLHTVSPLNGPAGTNVVISGVGLSGKSGPSIVTFNGKAAIVVSSSDTSLVAAVPDSAGMGPIVVKVDNSMATGPVFTYQGITFITPATGGAGTVDSIHGVGFGTDPTKDLVAFNGVAATILSVVDTMIVARVPANVMTGPVTVSINSQRTTGPVFTVVPGPVITTVTPSSGLAGATVVITGKNFSAVAGQNKVDFNGAAAVVSGATTTQLTVTIPAGATTGNLNISVNGQAVQGPVFTIQALNITALLPNSGLDGTTVLISGNGFDPNPANNQVTFNGLAAQVSAATPNQLTVTAPAGFTTGAVVVVSGGLTATGPVFFHAGVKTVYQDLSGSFVGLAVDAAGNIYYTQRDNNYNNLNRIMKIPANGGAVTVYAGSPTGNAGKYDGIGTAALFNNPVALAFDPQGNLYVGDNGNNALRMVDPSGQVSTVTTGTGSITRICFDPQSRANFISAGNNGIFVANGGSFGPVWPAAANINAADIAITPQGNVFYNDYYSPNLLREYVNGAVKFISSSFRNSSDYLALDPSTGNIIYADQGSAYFYSVDGLTGAVSNLYQSRTTYPGPPVDGPLSQANFLGVKFMTVEKNGAIYVIDGTGQQSAYIRKIFFH